MPTTTEHRRHRLRHAVSTRAFRWLAERRLIRAVPGERFEVNPHALHLPHLPEGLDGLRIVHLSDLHVGKILTPAHLPAIVEAVNALEADLVAVTGDLLDFSNRYLPDVVEAVGAMRAALGVFTVLGNHDYRESGRQVVRAFRQAELDLLVNDHVTVETDGGTIVVGGIDWAEEDARLQGYVRRTCAGMEAGDLRLLLAHHPHALDFAARCDVDLVLSGHTHGGQVLLRHMRPHARESLGLGNFKWRYPQGHYIRGRTHLFVTNGLGGSFPLRIRCPAEISVLTLRKR